MAQRTQTIKDRLINLTMLIKKKYLPYIYLAALDLYLHVGFFFLVVAHGIFLWHMRSFLVAACWVPVTGPGIKLRPLH